MPLVSVVIPTFNRKAYLPMAVESALAQDVDAEILVVDDGSDDGTASCIRPYVETKGVRYVWQPNAGVSAARNRGIAESRSEFVAFLDSDDIWTPTHLTRLLSAIQHYPDVAVGFCAFNFVGTQQEADSCNQAFGRSVRNLLNEAFCEGDDGVWLSDERLLQALINRGFPFRIQGSIFRRTFIVEHGLAFDERISYTEEAQFVLEAALFSRLLFLDHVGLLVRRHEGNAGDECYRGKVVDSYHRRLERLRLLCQEPLNAAERCALTQAIWNMRYDIMIHSMKNRSFPTRLVESVRFLAATRTVKSVRSCVKPLLFGVSDR